MWDAEQADNRTEAVEAAGSKLSTTETILKLLEELRETIIRQIGNGAEDGEDLFQETALACFEKVNDFDWSSTKSRGLILQIARCRWKDHLRREKYRQCVELPSDLGIRAVAASGAEECWEVIDNLPTRDRTLIHERFLNGKRPVEIARESGTPPGTIRSRCKRALDQLSRHPRIRSIAESSP